jgi:hypothetical protein
MTVKSDCIPEFFPGKPNQSSARWVDKIYQLARVNKWDENITIQLMQNRLIGLARSWYDNLTTYTYTWEEWKALLVRTFPDHHDFASTLRQVVDLVKQPNETMTQYYFGKMNLLQACNITGKEAVSCLVDGLKDRNLQNGAKAGRYETPENLYTEYLSALSAEAAESRNIRPKFGVERKEFGPRLGTRPININIPKGTLVRRELTCFNCNTSGHISRKCPKPKLECGNCKLLGHDESHCQRNKKNQTSR